jgi:hypothetical protein
MGVTPLITSKWIGGGGSRGKEEKKGEKERMREGREREGRREYCRQHSVRTQYLHRS